MHSAAIVFPDIDPVLISWGPIAIRWYALAYIAGLVIGWRYIVSMVETPGLWKGPAPLDREMVDDSLLWAALGVILGGRIGYVLFYNPAFYWEHPLDALKVWHGGMSFHGGTMGVIVAMWLFSRSRKIQPLTMLDLVTAAAPIGLFFGRIANFINGELWGRVTDVSWGVIFCNQRIALTHGGFCPAGDLPRHPSQLYEAALEGILLFIVLRIFTHKTTALRKPGTVAAMFLVGYGAARTFVEFFRQPDEQLGFLYGHWLTMGMLLSAPMVLLGLGLFAYLGGFGLKWRKNGDKEGAAKKSEVTAKAKSSDKK